MSDCEYHFIFDILYGPGKQIVFWPFIDNFFFLKIKGMADDPMCMVAFQRSHKVMEETVSRLDFDMSDIFFFIPP